MDNTLIKFVNLTKIYQTGGEAVEALSGINLEFETGHFVAIMGASGSGKSTMLNLIGMLDRPTGGSYYLEGRNVSSLDDDTLSDIRCRKIGIVFQSFNLFANYSILENICVPMQYAGTAKHKMLERGKELLDLVGLSQRAQHKPTQLSGGQCQRVAIARALANNPPVILADEPTGNLDHKTGSEIIDIFHELCATGRTVIMITHNQEYTKEVERVINLQDGKLHSDLPGGYQS